LNTKRQENQKDEQIRKLEQKILAKNEVLSELLEEHIRLKKTLGNSEERMDRT